MLFKHWKDVKDKLKNSNNYDSHNDRHNNHTHIHNLNYKAVSKITINNEIIMKSRRSQIKHSAMRQQFTWGVLRKGFKGVCIHILQQLCLAHAQKKIPLRYLLQKPWLLLPLPQLSPPPPTPLPPSPLPSDVGRYKMSFWGKRDNDSPP